MSVNPTIRILEIYFLPPMAVARLGGSATPVENYTWTEDPTIFGAGRTVIEPAVTLHVNERGDLQAYLPSQIRFRDSGLYRPVAPFFELWAGYRDNNNDERQDGPLNIALLDRAGASLESLSFFVRAANLKPARRSGDAANGFEAQLRVTGTDHDPHRLSASSPRTPSGESLVSPEQPIPLGTFQVVRPVPYTDAGVDLSVVRVRFTPAAGEVYGPPSAQTGPAPGTLRTHTIVKPEHRILNPQASWLKYDGDYAKFRNPEPSDTYDGADVLPEPPNQTFGVVDDTCDAVIQADFVIDGLAFQARARVFVGPPDFAPDRRPFLSLADELADRDPPTFAEPEPQADLERRINDLFQRALETAELLNLDAVRFRALGDNTNFLPQPDFPDLPKTDDRSMSPGDVPFADLSNTALESVPHDWLPRADLIIRAHGQLADLDTMVEKLREKAERVRRMIRPPYAKIRELQENPTTPAPSFRDPRVPRDQMHDMRMPPYMRDSDATALSLTHRQYHEVLFLIDQLEGAGRALRAGLASDALPPVPLDTPIRRRVAAVLANLQRSAEAAGPAALREAMRTSDQPRAPRTSALLVGKIFPRNLTARAAYRVAGNPESTRLESGVSNCYPGLEFDHRNLDRRFLPGLLIEFVGAFKSPDPNPTLTGGRLVAIDQRDPGLTPVAGAEPAEQAALQQLGDELSAAAQKLVTGDWFLFAVTQGGKRIEFVDQSTPNSPAPMDGMLIWRLIHGLENDAVTVELRARAMPNNHPLPDPVILHGWRRRFTDARTGVIGPVYQPGEMTQSLCSPWQHDFRDCGCTYWASNHPDIVMLEEPPGASLLPTGASANPEQALSRVRWLRSDRTPSRSPEARETYRLNRPVEMDHYEINQRWQSLAVVVGDREVSDVYQPRSGDLAQPFATASEMADRLTQLATLEHVLALEYLYAYYSVRQRAEVPDGPLAVTLRDDVVFIRHFVLLVAVNEMQHLRWANQLLWELKERGLIDPLLYGPSLGVAATIPVSASGGSRPRSLRPLTREALADFVAVERPSGFIEGQYARVVATLRQKDQGYPESLYQLGSRIANEGVEHFSRFRDIQAIMRQYQGTPWLRAITVGAPANADVTAALAQYGEIVTNLRAAYATGSVTDRQHITQARLAMTKLDEMAETLAAGGVGVPFFD
jgi:hypothetical protein